jgi:hypothetical protein
MISGSKPLPLMRSQNCLDDPAHPGGGCSRAGGSVGRSAAGDDEVATVVALGAFCARLPPAPGTALSPQIGRVADNAEYDRAHGRATKKACDPYGRTDGGCANIARNKNSAECRSRCRGLPCSADAHLSLPKNPVSTICPAFLFVPRAVRLCAHTSRRQR